MLLGIYSCLLPVGHVLKPQRQILHLYRSQCSGFSTHTLRRHSHLEYYPLQQVLSAKFSIARRSPWYTKKKHQSEVNSDRHQTLDQYKLKTSTNHRKGKGLHVQLNFHLTLCIWLVVSNFEHLKRSLNNTLFFYFLIFYSFYYNFNILSFNITFKNIL